MSIAELSSSSELLNDNWHHTGLQCDWLVAVLHGVEESKEMLSSLEMWWILGVCLRGVGMLKFSLPFSHPLSSNVSLLSKAALSVVTKDWIELIQIAGILGAWMYCKIKHWRLVQWHYREHEPQDQLSKTAMLLLWHSISIILWLLANNLWHSWWNVAVESNDAVLRVCTAIYIVISESIFVKRLKWVLIIQNCYLCVCPFMGRCVPYVYCSSKVNRNYCSLIVWRGYCCSRYTYQSIHRGATASSILSLTTDNVYIIMFPGFWMCYQMIHMQQLLMTASAASVDSLSM